MLAKLLEQNKVQIEKTLKIGRAKWDNLIGRVERQCEKDQGDYYDEQIWTFLACCGYAVVGASAVDKLSVLLCRQSQSTSFPKSIWFEALPIPPRENEGNTHLDLAIGNIARRETTASGIRYDEQDNGFSCFCECKWYSDISKDVTYDKHRNQLIRVVENALAFQSNGHFPAHVYVSLVTPRIFRDAPVKSRLYQYKYEEYKSDKKKMLLDLGTRSLREDKAKGLCAPQVEERVDCLSLNWITYEELYENIPGSNISEALSSFHGRFNQSGK